MQEFVAELARLRDRYAHIHNIPDLRKLLFGDPFAVLSAPPPFSPQTV